MITDRILRHIQEYREEIDQAGPYADVHIRVRPGHVDLDIVRRIRCQGGGCVDVDEIGGDAA